MALPRLREVVYLTYEQYLEIKANGHITVDGVTYNWDENAFYVTNQNDFAPTTNNYNDLDNKPIANTNNSNALSPVQSETLSGVVNFHKISKTGTSTDLVDSDTLVRFSNVSNTPSANMLVRYDSNGYLIANVIESDDGDNLISIMNSKIVVGEMTCELALQGSGTRPKYNNVELALKSDTNFSVSNSTGGSTNAVVLDWTNNVLSAQLNEDITAKLQKVLVLPMTRPASTELVAVDNSGGQAMVDIGANLTLTGDTLSADLSSCAKNTDFNTSNPTIFGPNTFPKMKNIWSGNIQANENGGSQTATFTETISSTDMLLLEVEIYRSGKFYMLANMNTRRLFTGDIFNNNVIVSQSEFNWSTTGVSLGTVYAGYQGHAISDTANCYNVWKIIK